MLSCGLILPIHRLAVPRAFRPLAVLCGAMIGLPGGSLRADSDYVLRVNDQISIAVFQEPDLTTETRISKSGRITFPLVGSLALEGKTIEEAVALLRERLDRDYIIDPHVTLTVTDYASERVTILGQVMKPGTIGIPDEGSLDVLSAIAMAGGYTETAEAGAITIRRRVGDEDQLLQIDGVRLANDRNAKPVMVQPNDVITVADKPMERVTVLGEVQKPGVVDIPLNSRMDLLKAIAMAGGYTKTANPSRIRVRRRVEGGDKLYLIDGEKLANEAHARPFVIQSDDVVIVGESLF